MDALPGRPWPLQAEGVALDAERLAEILARLDVGSIPQAALLFPANGPQVQPLFRGIAAELLLVRWQAGQSTPVVSLGDSAMAIRPLEGELWVATYHQRGRQGAELGELTAVGPNKVAGVPQGSLHALHAEGPCLSLHLCAPPVVWRGHVESARS